jgi:RND family efflux transporter MFP subunit
MGTTGVMRSPHMFQCRVGIGCVLAMLAGGCAKPPAPIAQLPVPVVTVEQPVQQDVQETYETTGRVSATETVQVLPRVSGYITEVLFRDGQRVSAGDVLFKIDPRPFEATLAQAEAQVNLEEARVLKTTADLARQKELVSKKATTKEEFDLAVAERASAEALREQAVAKVTSAKLDLEFATVTAPIAGKTSTSTVKVGSLVGGATAGLSPLTMIVSTNPIHVYFNIDERTVLRIRDGMVAEGRSQELGGSEVAKAKIPLTIRLENNTLPPVLGTLDFVDNQVDPQTGTIRVRGVFANDPELLTDGMFVRVSMPIGKPRPALLVAERAVQANLGTKLVYVVDDANKARAVTVTVGFKQGGLVELTPTAKDSAATPPLTTAAKVITAGLQRVRDGAEVKPEAAVSAPKAPETPAAKPAEKSP